EINGIKTIITLNSHQALYRILQSLVKGVTLDKNMKLPPGASYDPITRRITFMPPIVPIDYGTEMDTYRNAVLLLSTSA
ncbi:MAG: hypothetical protein WC592_08570, partial [Candidatus Omnitrophota bacterium]